MTEKANRTISRTMGTVETIRIVGNFDLARRPVQADEREILRRCKKGDEEAYRQLVHLYQQRTVSVAFRLLGDWETALDVSQEAFVRVFRSIGKFDLSKNFCTWFYRIIVNLAIDRMRKERHEKGVPLDEGPELGGADDNPHDSTATNETRREVWETLGCLPPKYKTILVLRDIEGLSCEEISRIIGITNETVRWRIHKARKLFRNVWEGRAI